MLTQRPPIHSLPDSYFDRSPYTTVSRPSQRSQPTTRPIATPVSTASRKRPRANPHQQDVNTYPAHSPASNLDTSIASLDCLSPAPLANTEYFLSGGLDTPGAWSYQRDERSELFEAEQDQRWNRFSTHPQHDPSFHSNSGGFDERSKSIQVAEGYLKDPKSVSLSGWHLRKVAWAVTGGLAGKIINFCWNTTFRGFSAGGGPSYTTGADGTVVRNASSNHHFSGNHHDQRHLWTSPSKPSRPALERSNTRSSWVFVESADTAPEREHSPLRKKSRASMAGSNRDALGWGDNIHAHQRSNSSTASFASPRAGGIGTPSIATPSAHTYTYSSSSTQVTFSPKRQRTSITSPTRRQSSQSDIQQGNGSASSSSSPEAEALKRQKRRDKRRQDESLSRFNSQLKDLIREGKQALGSKVEVIDSRNDYDMDEGCFVDDTDDNEHHVL